jgi:hypothetical protein
MPAQPIRSCAYRGAWAIIEIMIFNRKGGDAQAL